MTSKNFFPIGWIEPLLSHISTDHERVVCPVIDIIHEDTFQYVRSLDLHWGAFNWNLHFRWLTLGKRRLNQPKTDLAQPYMYSIMMFNLISLIYPVILICSF